MRTRSICCATCSRSTQISPARPQFSLGGSRVRCDQMVGSAATRGTRRGRSSEGVEMRRTTARAIGRTAMNRPALGARARVHHRRPPRLRGPACLTAGSAPRPSARRTRQAASVTGARCLRLGARASTAQPVIRSAVVFPHPLAVVVVHRPILPRPPHPLRRTLGPTRAPLLSLSMTTCPPSLRRCAPPPAALPRRTRTTTRSGFPRLNLGLVPDALAHHPVRHRAPAPHHRQAIEMTIAMRTWT